MAWPWDRLSDQLWKMFSCVFTMKFLRVKYHGLNSAQKNLNQFFTDDMLITFLFSLNQLKTSQNFVIILLVIQTCLFPLNKKKWKVVISWYRSSCEKEKFVTTFSDAFTHFKTFLPTIYTDLVWFILFLIVVLKFVRLGQSFLDKFFLKNKYSLLFIDNCFKTFVDKLFIKHPQLTKVEKKTLFLPPQYLNRNFLTNKN